ncbi:glycosyltransferase BC10-like isoform X3 [Carex rostrata]
MPPPPRARPSRRPVWIIVLIAFFCAVLIWAYVSPSDKPYRSCYYIFSSDKCNSWPPPTPARVYTDEEITSRVVIKDILSAPAVQSKNPKIAFMFLTPGSLPFERLWEKFFQVVWGTSSMVDAEKRLLANALQDPDNQHFVLLSDSCVPLHNFDYVYQFLLGTNISFVDCFEDPGPHGNGRYSEHMLPEVEKKDWRKGAQWFTVKRQHAVLILTDSLYYNKFKHYCKPGEGKNCYADEHYLPTLFNMVDPNGIANWSVTHVDWSEGKWHPKAYRAADVTFELLKNISSIDHSIHVTSNAHKQVQQKPCLWNGMKRPCYLFARKFYPECLDNLMNLFSNFTVF